MTRLASTCWATALLGVGFTSSALAQTAPDPNVPDEPAPMPTAEPAPMPAPEPAPMPAQQAAPVEVEVHTPPPAAPQTSYIVAPTPIMTEEEETGPLSGIGVAIAAGGGAGGFTEEALRDTANVGGDWDVRLTLGTRSPLAFEGSYIGSAQSIDALGLDNDAVLVGNGVQGALRLNATTGMAVQPFLYAGAAWRRYDITNADTNLSDVRGEDDVLEIPLGIGIAGNYRGMILDARGEFRAVTAEDLLPEGGSQTNFTEMHRWGVKGTVGFEF